MPVYNKGSNVKVSDVVVLVICTCVLKRVAVKTSLPLEPG